MRHTVATRLLRVLKFDITYVQFWLGHTNIKSTMVYTEVKFEDIQRALQRAPNADIFANPKRSPK
jgi:site-specific recombinase XerD